MMARYYFGLAAASALLLAMSAPSYAQRTVVGGKPRVTITPAPWIPAPVPVQSIFPTISRTTCLVVLTSSHLPLQYC
jgi:hypothetical protein